MRREVPTWASQGPLPIAEHGGPWPGLVRERVDHRKKLHLTGKPVELMVQLVHAVAPGGVILDPFMGSASTGVAALQAGHRFIDVEQDGHYFDVAVARLEAICEAGQATA